MKPRNVKVAGMGTIGIDPFSGEHCESTTLVNLLRQRDVRLSEPMVFGLGQGLSFIYWLTKRMDVPLLGGRVKPDLITANLASALGLDLRIRETASEKRALDDLVSQLDAGSLVGLKLDRYFLDYSSDEHHFAAHYVACTGYDADSFALVDTVEFGQRATSRASLAKARSFKGPMSSRNMSFTIHRGAAERPPVKDLIAPAVRATADAFLAPPIGNIGFPGVQKTSRVMVDWLDSLASPAEALSRIGSGMEHGGTGGGLFRTMWARFLDEAAQLTGDGGYQQCAVRYYDISKKWTEVAALIKEAGSSLSRATLVRAARIVAELAGEERDAMRQLIGVSG